MLILNLAAIKGFRDLLFSFNEISNHDICDIPDFLELALTNLMLTVEFFLLLYQNSSNLIINSNRNLTVSFLVHSSP